jgi:hypothetical protein
MQDDKIIKDIRYDKPTTGFNETSTQVKSIVFEMKEPIRIEDEVSQHWVLLVEESILDQAQIASINVNTPIGWELGNIVYDDEQGANDKWAIEWMAENFERLNE